MGNWLSFENELEPETAPGSCVPKEIEVKTSMGAHVDPLSNYVTEILDPALESQEIFLLKDVLNATETEKLVQDAEKYGFGFTNYEKSYRGNLRLITYDQSLANAIWQRIKPFVPSTVTERGKVFTVIGLNECWRMAKYFPPDCFRNHVDAYFATDDPISGKKTKSMFTVNIYMNDGFLGGETVFHLKAGEKIIVPETGLCLIFRQPPSQRYLHEGLELKSGLKYLFRSDVMYQEQL